MAIEGEQLSTLQVWSLPSEDLCIRVPWSLIGCCSWSWEDLVEWSWDNNLYCLRRNSISQFIDTPAEKRTYPLKIDGWKVTFPFKMVPFQGTSSFSRGCIIINYTLWVWTFKLLYDRRLHFGWPILFAEKGSHISRFVVCLKVSLHSLWGLSARTSQLWGTWMLWGFSYGSACQWNFTRWEGYGSIIQLLALPYQNWRTGPVHSPNKSSRCFDGF